MLTDLTGAGPWLRLTAGATEVAGALLLLAPAVPATIGALLLGALTAATGAAYVAVVHVAPTLPGALLALLAAIAYARRAALARVRNFLVRNP